MSPDPETLPARNRPWEETSRNRRLGCDNRTTTKVLSDNRISAARVIASKGRAAQRYLASMPVKP